MQLTKRLDTPFKRLSFLIMISGTALLVFSFATWFLSSYPITVLEKRHSYIWRIDGNGTLAKTIWHADGSCITKALQPYLDAYKAEANTVENNSPDDTALKPELKALVEKQQRIDLLSKISFLENSLGHYQTNPAIDEFEVAKHLRPDIDNPIATLLKGGFSEKEIIEWQKENNLPVSDLEDFDPKAREYLVRSIDRYVSPEDKKRIINECVVPSTLKLHLADVRYYSELAEWPSHKWLSVTLGITLIMVGLIGSFLYSHTLSPVLRVTKAIHKWIKTGDRA